MTAALARVDGVTILKVSDRTFLVHLGGKIEIQPKLPIRNRDDLSMIYTPGVARVCLAIAENPEDARRLTIKRNTVAVVTDGSAVLGLGNLGALAALPVMEGKAALFKRFAGIDAFPICLDTQDVDEIVRTVELIAPVFAGINLEDISAPRCFEIERRLRASLDIPVFHDDQHGTAIVVLAALINALKVVGKDIGDVRIVLSGAGAAGMAILDGAARGGSRRRRRRRQGRRHPPGPRGPGRRARAGSPSTRTPTGVRGDLRDGPRRCRRLHRRLGAQHPHRRRHRDDGRRTRSCSRWPIPTPEVDPVGGVRARRRRGERPQRLRQPDQQRARLPRRLPRAARRRTAARSPWTC